MPQLYLKEIIAVAAGAFIGGWLRTLIDDVAANQFFFGFGIFLINVTGAFAIGLFSAMEEMSKSPQKWRFWRLFCVTGILGAYTTFSGLAWNALQCNPWGGVAYVTGMLIIGIAACWLGYRAVPRLFKANTER